MASISLPCFEGYDQFAIWTTSDSVSKTKILLLDQGNTNLWFAINPDAKIV